MKKLALSAAAMLTVPAITAVAHAEDTVCFVVREYNGKIALFSDNSDEPLAIYKTPLTSLYPGDLELLREGIRLKNRAEVTRLLADLDIG